MLRRSRVGSIIDMNRLSMGVSRPGIDPRIWASHALALDESQFDEDHGWFIDVQLIPTGEEITCYVPSQYAGSEFGESECTIHKDDHLFVIIPNGDPAQGGVVHCRLWTEAAKPPKAVSDNSKDYVRVQEKDTSYRVTVTGDGKIVWTNNKIRIGDEDADQKLLMGSDFRDKQKSMHDSLKTQFDNLSSAMSDLNTALTTLGTSLTFAGVLVPAAAAAAKAAVSAFTTSAGMAVSNAQSAASALKSAVSDFESAASNDQDFLSEAANVSKKGKN